VATVQFSQQWVGLPRLSSKFTLSSRVEKTVDHRAGLYEEITPVRRAIVRRAASSPSIRAAISDSDDLLRGHLTVAFAPELATLPDAARQEHLAAIETATSWESWDRLRTTSGLSVRSAKRVVARTLMALSAETAAAGRSTRTAAIS
jgi:hypothetical protein